MEALRQAQPFALLEQRLLQCAVALSGHHEADTIRPVADDPGGVEQDVVSLRRPQVSDCTHQQPIGRQPYLAAQRRIWLGPESLEVDAVFDDSVVALTETEAQREVPRQLGRHEDDAAGAAAHHESLDRREPRPGIDVRLTVQDGHYGHAGDPPRDAAIDRGAVEVGKNHVCARVANQPQQRTQVAYVEGAFRRKDHRRNAEVANAFRQPAIAADHNDIAVTNRREVRDESAQQGFRAAWAAGVDQV